MDQEVELFEQSILDFADVFTKKAKRGAIVMQGRTTSPTLLVPSQVGSDGNSGASTPSLTSGSDTGTAVNGGADATASATDDSSAKMLRMMMRF